MDTTAIIEKLEKTAAAIEAAVQAIEAEQTAAKEAAVEAIKTASLKKTAAPLADSGFGTVGDSPRSTAEASFLSKIL